MSFGIYYIYYLISGIISIILLSLVCIILIRSYLKSKNTSTLYFIISFILIDFWSIVTTIYPILPYDYALIVSNTAISLVYLGFYSLFLFLETINFKSINVYRATFFSVLITIAITLVLTRYGGTLEYVPNFGYIQTPGLIMVLIQGMMLAGILILFLYTIIRIRRLAGNPDEQFQANFFTLGVIIMVFGGLFSQPIRILFQNIFAVDFRGFLILFISIGAVFTAIAYLKNPDVAFNLPFKVRYLMVLSRAGICFYSIAFEESEEINDVLVSGMISGITGFMVEALGIKTQLKEIVFGDKHIILDLREKIGVFIISDSSSKMLKKALRTFTDYFESNFSEHLDSNNIDHFSPAEEGVKKYFKFLMGKWKLNENESDLNEI
ncbi:MAG: hypothetical protein EU549_01780 [Promethearchaeota archaeon]|nr:MAG: hypothetical protein EU549_01780 [Candidatus Lokiarchaeota archaeon]